MSRKARRRPRTARADRREGPVGRAGDARENERMARIAAAFDGEAADYERRFSDHPSARAMRAASHRLYAAYLKPGMSVLDLNCGPGSDFPFFKQHGVRLTALDASPKMLALARERDAEASLLCLDYNHIDRIPGRFHAICSNFGGLNTQPEFGEFAAKCRDRLHPHGFLFLNIMTPLPLGEILEGLFRRRHFFRRLRRGGRQRLRVGKRQLDTYYFFPKRFYRTYFRESFRLLKLRGLGVFLPPPYLANESGRIGSPVLRLERMFGGFFPFNRLGDHAMLVLRRRA